MHSHSAKQVTTHYMRNHSLLSATVSIHEGGPTRCLGVCVRKYFFVLSIALANRKIAAWHSAARVLVKGRSPKSWSITGSGRFSCTLFRCFFLVVGVLDFY
jgi:hypothetical protein